MESHSPPKSKHRGFAAFHKPFTLLSPTIGHESQVGDPIPRSSDSVAPDPSFASARQQLVPSGGLSPLANTDFPAPSPYDVSLILNSEPGLDSWWTNLVQILQEYYGAERVALAVPGDATDLENVPWAQKATFKPVDHARELQLSKRLEKLEIDEKNPKTAERDMAIGLRPPPSPAQQRPSLQSRHSFAGYVTKTEESLFKNNEESEQPRRPKGPGRALSNVSMGDAKLDAASRRRGQSDAGDSGDNGGVSSDGRTEYFDAPESPLLQPIRVFPVPQPLGKEEDALIRQSGIGRLLCRDKVVVITRNYKDPSLTEAFRKGKAPAKGQSKDDTVKATGTGRPRSTSALSSKSSKSGNRTAATAHGKHDSRISYTKGDDSYFSPMSKRSYEEYEQAPTSPWSQSPAPSPAARPDPEQNPFFQQTLVDEDAFASHHEDSHNYAQTHPLPAIGVDRETTVLHIPLYRRPVSRPHKRFQLHLARQSVSPSDPVFSAQGDRPGETDYDTPTLLNPRKPTPIGIISVLSSIVPYPHNLQQSLDDLIPLLTSSFSNAGQYSNLERQANNLTIHQFGHSDLGGTFSTTSSSQLEAVIEQREQLYSPTGDDDPAPSTGSSVVSPGEIATRLRSSEPGSAAGTPAWDPSHVGLSTDAISTPGHRTSMEGVEGYFAARSPGHHSSSGKVTSPRRSGPKKKPSDQELQRPTPKHSRLHTLGANVGATFPTLQESPNTPASIGRSQEPARRTSSSTSQAFQIKEPSESLMRLVLDFLPLQIFMAEPRTGNLTWINSKFHIYRNQDPQQIFEDPWQSIYDPDREEFVKGWNNALLNESQYTCQVRLKRYDDAGDCRWFHFRAIAMLNATGVAVHWLGTFVDIHKQHQAEVEAAREKQMVLSEAKYRALANLSPLIVFAAEESKGIIFANDQWEAFSGQKLSDAMHYGFISYVHPDDMAQYKISRSFRTRSKTVPPSPPVSGRSGRDSEVSSSSEKTIQGDTQALDAETLEEGSDVMPALVDLAERGLVKIQKDHTGKTSYSTEIRLRSGDGNYRWHLVRLVQVDPINFGHGEASWYGTCTDINDHKMLEQKLNQTMESKTNFFSTMSHELRTPLNGIIGNIPFLLEGDLNQEQTSLLETMQGSAVNLLDLINNIMDLSKVEAGRMSISKHWFHVRSVIEDVNDTVAPKAIEKGLELNYLVDNEVASMVKGDPFRIRQVLINLVSNAVKFTSEGGVFIHCSVRHDETRILADNETLLDFQVIDTGMGFSDEEAKLLFKQFSQIDGSNTKQHGGSGLGLMISRQLVELHGGKLVATSIPQVGSTFSFFIKFLVPTGEDRPSSPPRPSDALSRMSTASSISSRGPAQSPDVLRFNREFGQESPAVNSSASSDPSIRSMSNYRSERSSLSSIIPSEGSPIKLTMPSERRLFTELPSVEEGSPHAPIPSIARAMQSRQSSVSHEGLRPTLYSILVVCPVDQHRAAITQHIEHVIPDNVPHSVTDIKDIDAAQRMISGDDAVIFTHIVLNLRDTESIVDFLHLILEAKSPLPTSMVIVTDHIQKRELVRLASNFDFARLELDSRVHVVYRPSKPSKFAVIFDPAQERDLSKDRNRSAAQEVSDNFKVTAQLVKDTIGDRGYRILIVEDNKTNLDVSGLEPTT
jgi:signal transduction histidine kinase